MEDNLLFFFLGVNDKPLVKYPLYSITQDSGIVILWKVFFAYVCYIVLFHGCCETYQYSQPDRLPHDFKTILNQNYVIFITFHYPCYSVEVIIVTVFVVTLPFTSIIAIVTIHLFLSNFTLLSQFIYVFTPFLHLKSHI